MTRAAEWAQRVSEWRASGMTSKEFCAGRGYSAQNLLYWSSELRRREAEAVRAERGIAFSRVVRRAPAPGMIVVRTKRARVEVLPNADRATLAMVFEALGVTVQS
jgi:hypothetical protein